MIAVVLMAAALLIWGVAIVSVDYFAQRRIRKEAEDRETDFGSVGDEAEWWLRHH